MAARGESATAANGENDMAVDTAPCAVPVA